MVVLDGKTKSRLIEAATETILADDGIIETETEMVIATAPVTAHLEEIVIMGETSDEEVRLLKETMPKRNAKTKGLRRKRSQRRPVQRPVLDRK